MNTATYSPGTKDSNTVTKDELLQASSCLYQYLLKTHWNGRAVAGSDPGIRFNSRIGRFIKSYTRFLPWLDDMVYVQAQKYWIMSNWRVAEMGLADAQQCKDVARACADYLLAIQCREGYWEYPNKEWGGRIATVEGNYGAMGLTEVYLRTRQGSFLEGAKNWYRYAVNEIGFGGKDGLAAINYFAHMGSSVSVPNVTVSPLRTFALLAEASGDDQYLEYCDRMVRWLGQVQRCSGELPYAIVSPEGGDAKQRIHFLCYQYNAFELLNLIAYYRLTHDGEAWPIMEKLASFVAEGVSDNGACRYDCNRDTPEVSYYTAASAAALHQATECGIGDYRAIADRAYRRVLSQQKPNGGMTFYSKGNYGFLSDRRSYPRYLSMTLYLFLVGAKGRSEI